ncbi:bromodomain-containing protein 1-like isoform X2 [Festucalex cinctus]
MKKKARHPRPAALKRDSSPIKPSPNRETLTYAQAQRMVELEVDGRVHRLSIYDKLDVVGDDEPTAQEILECNSNKENSEKPQQAPVRSARLKNSQRNKKSAAALAAPHGAAQPAPAPAPPPPEPRVRTVEYHLPVVPKRPAAYYTYAERTAEELDEEVEYDMDEEDYAWLELLNEKRRSDGISQVSSNLFEFLMDRLEKESYGDTRGQGEPAVDEDAVCCVCMDGDGADSNVILFCDACNIAVHQECYGVPHVPEGRWLCRHCLQRPAAAAAARPADCVFCPNRGGALKRTADGRWGHVACALWVPEVGFSDAVFVEPIDGVGDVPPARWKLTCYLCKEKGAGACIQCDRANCYAAFHVSCAQKAGLFMKMETAPGAFAVKKTAYCRSHTPAGGDRRPLNVYEGAPHRKNGACHRRGERRGRARARHWCKKRSKRPEPPPEPRTEADGADGNAAGPSITASSLDSILNQVAVQRKRPFVERVLSYWVLKRKSRNNVPLIRRLQANTSQAPKSAAVDRAETNQALKEQLKEWHRLRHDLERARLLLELIRKREKLKRDEMKLQQSALEVQLTPFTILLRTVLSQLQQKDQYNVFAQPVSIKEVPDYLEHIKQPMDFSTMRARVDGHAYRGLDDFEADFDLIIANCMKYNAKETFFYKVAQRMQDHGGVILRRARKEADRIGFDFPSGLMLPQAPKLEAPPPFTWDDVDRLLSPSYRRLTPLEDQLKELLEKLDLSTAMKNSPSRSKRLKLLKKTIMEVRSEMSLRKAPPASAAARPESPRAPELSVSVPPTPTPSETPPDLGPPSLTPAERVPAEPGDVTCTQATSEPRPKLNGHLPDGDQAERRTNSLFAKSKSVSPQKPVRGQEATGAPPPSPQSPLGAKTFLSVVIPRLETLLLPKKRPRSSSVDGDEDEESPIKRLGTGITNGFVVEADEEEETSPTRLLEPRRRCASESSISSGASALSAASTAVLSKSGKGRPAAAAATAVRRNTADDKLAPTSCAENGELSPHVQVSSEAWKPSAAFPFVVEPLKLVWAKCSGYPSYPALIVDPRARRTGRPTRRLRNGATAAEAAEAELPRPPRDVLRAGERMQFRSAEKLFLVHFFDSKRSWQWLPRSKMSPFGVDRGLDHVKLLESRRSHLQKSVQRAFERAMKHLDGDDGDGGKAAPAQP